VINIPCVIFAGGKSSRMGEDKALLPFGDFKTLTQFQYSRLSQIFQTVYISCKDKNKFDFQANYIEDEKKSATYAPTAGFIAAFNSLKEDSFFAISVDAPFISSQEINKILNADTHTFAATIAKTQNGMEPLCGIYHRQLHSKFQEMQKNDSHKLGQLLKNSNTTYVYFEDKKPFLNLNHPHDYQEALRLLK